VTVVRDVVQLQRQPKEEAMEIRPDHELAADVRAALRLDPHVDAAAIAVHADRGAVALVGTVTSPVEARAAERAAERVTGALLIENRLTTRPPAPDRRRDVILRATALQALADRGVQIGEEVDVDASDGRVTITGRMHSAADRAAAVATVGSLPGVVAVENDVRVPDELRPSLQRR
jgi:osmotically-inducible protein OsmY